MAKTVRDQAGEDMATARVIYASEPEPCVICGAVKELRYGCCFGCAATTSWDDPRVIKDKRQGDIGVKAGIYRHWKGGYYQVLGVAVDATNEVEDYGTRYVVYVALDPTRPGPRLRIRRESEFNEMIPPRRVTPERHRFEYVGDEIPEGK